MVSKSNSLIVISDLNLLLMNLTTFQPTIYNFSSLHDVSLASVISRDFSSVLIAEQHHVNYSTQILSFSISSNTISLENSTFLSLPTNSTILTRCAFSSLNDSEFSFLFRDSLSKDLYVLTIDQSMNSSWKVLASKDIWSSNSSLNCTSFDGNDTILIWSSNSSERFAMQVSPSQNWALSIFSFAEADGEVLGFPAEDQVQLLDCKLLNNVPICFLRSYRLTEGNAMDRVANWSFSAQPYNFYTLISTEEEISYALSVFSPTYATSANSIDIVKLNLQISNGDPLPLASATFELTCPGTNRRYDLLGFSTFFLDKKQAVVFLITDCWTFMFDAHSMNLRRAIPLEVYGYPLDGCYMMDFDHHAMIIFRRESTNSSDEMMLSYKKVHYLDGNETRWHEIGTFPTDLFNGDLASAAIVSDDLILYANGETFLFLNRTTFNVINTVFSNATDTPSPDGDDDSIAFIICDPNRPMAYIIETTVGGLSSGTNLGFSSFDLTTLSLWNSTAVANIVGLVPVSAYFPDNDSVEILINSGWLLRVTKTPSHLAKLYRLFLCR